MIYLNRDEIIKLAELVDQWYVSEHPLGKTMKRVVAKGDIDRLEVGIEGFETPRGIMQINIGVVYQDEILGETYSTRTVVRNLYEHAKKGLPKPDYRSEGLAKVRELIQDD